MTSAVEPGGIVVELSPKEAMTVLAALRQYMPYWPATCDEARLAERLADIRMDVDAVTARIRALAASSTG